MTVICLDYDGLMTMEIKLARETPDQPAEGDELDCLRNRRRFQQRIHQAADNRACGNREQILHHMFYRMRDRCDKEATVAPSVYNRNTWIVPGDCATDHRRRDDAHRVTRGEGNRPSEIKHSPR